MRVGEDPRVKRVTTVPGPALLTPPSPGLRQSPCGVKETSIEPGPPTPAVTLQAPIHGPGGYWTGRLSPRFTDR